MAVEKYSMVECLKCKQSIPFDGSNDIKVNGQSKYFLCWKCERSIMGGEKDG